MPLSPAQCLIQYWTSLGYVVKTGASEQSLRAFEARYQVLLPSDVREYFALYGGFEGQANWDDYFIGFWPLESVVRLSDEDGEYMLPNSLGPSNTYFIIGDYLINSHFYAIQLTQDPSGSNAVVAYESYKFGDSFTAFVAIYLQNPELIASPPLHN
ncbi:MAG: SMI1/KNR4 family protein [Chloroflexota bacterium]|nr:SMI1/KNR4 family protein [Chloroflexota bacterium]